MTIDLTQNEASRLATGSLTLWRPVDVSKSTELLCYECAGDLRLPLSLRLGGTIYDQPCMKCGRWKPLGDYRKLPRPGDIVECRWRVEPPSIPQAAREWVVARLPLASIRPCRVRDVTEQEAEAMGYERRENDHAVVTARQHLQCATGLPLDAWGYVMRLEVAK